MLKTQFWKNAAASLSPSTRERYMHDIEQAERWELALDNAIEAMARIKAAFATRGPRGAH